MSGWRDVFGRSSELTPRNSVDFEKLDGPNPTRPNGCVGVSRLTLTCLGRVRTDDRQSLYLGSLLAAPHVYTSTTLRTESVIQGSRPFIWPNDMLKYAWDCRSRNRDHSTHRPVFNHSCLPGYPLLRLPRRYSITTSYWGRVNSALVVEWVVGGPELEDLTVGNISGEGKSCT